MSTQPVQQPQMQLVFAKRAKKRTAVYEFFEANIGKKFASHKLHLPKHLGGFGSSVRTRISEVNKLDDGEIEIRNETTVDSEGNECSVYYAVRKA